MLAIMKTSLATSALRDGVAAGVMAVSFAAVLAATTTIAKPTFDGEWSVAIITQKGDCDVRCAIRSASRTACCSMPVLLRSIFPAGSAATARSP